MPSKMVPKVILEGTRQTLKTDIACALNEHPRVVGPRKYRYHSPPISAEGFSFTNYPWGRGGPMDGRLSGGQPAQGERAPRFGTTIRDIYDTWSSTYDADENLTRDLDEAVTRQALADRRWGSAIELGCGTGKNTALLVQIAERVLAFDLSQGMIRRAQGKVAAANLLFCMADITRPWPCNDSCADLVVCNLVLEHIEDVGPVFAEASRALVAGGRFFLCELHPFKQYRGTRAHFERAGGAIEIKAYVHHISDFLHAAESHGLAPVQLEEWWHLRDEGKPPRVVSFLFVKRGGETRNTRKRTFSVGSGPRTGPDHP